MSLPSWVKAILARLDAGQVHEGLRVRVKPSTRRTVLGVLLMSEVIELDGIVTAVTTDQSGRCYVSFSKGGRLAVLDFDEDRERIGFDLTDLDTQARVYGDFSGHGRGQLLGIRNTFAWLHRMKSWSEEYSSSTNAEICDSILS